MNKQKVMIGWTYQCKAEGWHEPFRATCERKLQNSAIVKIIATSIYDDEKLNSYFNRTVVRYEDMQEAE